MPAETYPDRFKKIEDDRHYEDKYHEGQHGKHGHKGHKRKSFFSELFD